MSKTFVEPAYAETDSPAASKPFKLPAPLASLKRLISEQILNRLADKLFHASSNRLNAKTAKAKLQKNKLLSPEAEIKHLMTDASSLEDIWQFFLKRLSNGTDLDLLCFSVLDESGDFIRVKFLHPIQLQGRSDSHKSTYQPIISINDSSNHLVLSYQRKDTTFAPSIQHLGPELEALIDNYLSLNQYQTQDWLDCEFSNISEEKAAQKQMNIFSVPFIAANKTIAMLTLGFREMDAFSQAKLSYVYTLRDQIAQLVWNLVLQDRMHTQTQFDSLTGLLSHSSFQHILENELEKTLQNQTSTSMLVIDVNHIHQINQDYGHCIGDSAICHLASTVRRSIRGLDTVARHGGDDIVVLLPETDSTTAANIAENIILNLNHQTPKNLPALSISIGHSTFPDDSKKKDDLIKLAEQAMNLAKFKGSKTGLSKRIAASDIDTLSEKAILEIFAAQVSDQLSKKYSGFQVPSIYQDLLNQIEKKPVDFNKAKPLSTDELMLETITSLAGALDAKDRYTRGHSQAVANYAVALAHALKMSPAEVEETRLAAFLHDIGKIGIPESILCKQGPLTDKEWEIMKQHPVIGAEQILAPVSSLKPIIPAVLHHHENWDGTGHPHGLKGEDIPIGARIVSLVDAFHALTSDRAYRKALPVIEAKKILEEGSGTKWDPCLIEVFFGILTIANPKGNTQADATEPQNSSQTTKQQANEQEGLNSISNEGQPKAASLSPSPSALKTAVMSSPLSVNRPANEPIQLKLPATGGIPDELCDFEAEAIETETVNVGLIPLKAVSGS